MTTGASRSHWHQLRLLWPLGLAVSLMACGGDQADLRAYIEKVKRERTTGIEALPVVNPPESFIYQATDLRDPFAGGPTNRAPEPPNPKINANSGLAPNDHRKEVLEGFELDSLQMVGTLEFLDQSYGLVTDPNGLVHQVQKDHYLGRNDGQIINIHESWIEIQELIPNGAGGWKIRKMSLALDDS